MNLTPQSFSVPSSAAQAHSGVSTELDGAMGYSSPSSHLELQPESMRDRSGQVIGLGILQCGTESLRSQSRICARSEPMNIPMNEWQGNAIPTHGLPNAFLSVGGISRGTMYQTYEGRSISSNPTYDFGHLSSHNMNPSLSYDPETEVRSNKGTFYDQTCGSWPVTPRSRATTPSGTTVSVKEEFDGTWEPPFFRDSQDERQAQALAALPQAPVNGSSYSEIPAGLDSGRVFNETPELSLSVKRDRSSSADYPSIELSAKLEKDNGGASVIYDSAFARGLQCSVCGYTFTRRSNCREHMKKHDPSLRKDHECATCGRSFGRRTDLKRHVESIHHGTRRFGCDQCGRRFTRHDTLTRRRHRTDGCKQKQRKQDRVESPIPLEPFEQYPSPSPSFESQLNTCHSGSQEESVTVRRSLQPGPVNPLLGNIRSQRKRK